MSAPVADKALAERLARHSDGATKGRWCQFNPRFAPEAEGTKCTEWDTSHNMSAVANGHRVRLAEWRHADDAAYAEVLVNAHRSGQLITLAEAQAMVAAERERCAALIDDWWRGGVDTGVPADMIRAINPAADKPQTEYERKVAQMKKDFPNGI